MTISAIIPAAGCGSRAGFSRNKLLTPLGGEPVIRRTIAAFLQCGDIDEIILAARGSDLHEMKALFFDHPTVRVVLGGETRAATVYRALQACSSPDYVLVHDGARPFVTQKIIRDCIETVRNHGSAVCALPATDTAALCRDGKLVQPLPREQVYILQTPQAFTYRDILRAYEQVSEGENFTDDSGVYAKYIAPPQIFYGDSANKKLTYRNDFEEPLRVGIGIDTHAFGKAQPYIVLGGARIPSESGLVAHSDGDVLVHAVMDALLSAAALPDIGHYFPDTDDTYKNADSIELLIKVRELLHKQNLAPFNVSAAVQAQKPRLFAHIPAMRENIARALGIPQNRVGISAGTNEGLGYIGEGKGITVTAYVSVENIKA